MRSSRSKFGVSKLAMSQTFLPAAGFRRRPIHPKTTLKIFSHTSVRSRKIRWQKGTQRWVRPPCCAWRNARFWGAFIRRRWGEEPQAGRSTQLFRTPVCGGKTVSIAQLLDPALMDHFNQQARTFVGRRPNRVACRLLWRKPTPPPAGGCRASATRLPRPFGGLDYMFFIGAGWIPLGQLSHELPAQSG